MIGTKRSHPGDDEGDAELYRPSKAHRFCKEQQFVREGNNTDKIEAFEKRRPDLVLAGRSTQEPQQD